MNTELHTGKPAQSLGSSKNNSQIIMAHAGAEFHDRDSYGDTFQRLAYYNILYYFNTFVYWKSNDRWSSRKAGLEEQQGLRRFFDLVAVQKKDRC